MFVGTVDRHRDQPADVGQEALGAGQADVVLDDLLDRLVLVALPLVEVLLRRPSRPPSSGPTPADRPVQRLVDEPGRELRGHLGDLGREVRMFCRRAWRCSCAKRTNRCHHGSVPVEPPATPWAFPPADSGDGDLVAIGADLAPGTVLMAYRRGLFPMAVDLPGSAAHATGGGGDGLVVTGPARCPPALRAAGHPLDAPVGSSLRDPRRHRVRRGRRGMRRPGPVRRLDRPAHRGGVHRAAPPRLGPLRRGLARRRARGGSLRRRHRRPVRRRVDVHPGARRLEGRADGAGRPAPRRVRRPALLDTQWQTPHLATLGVVEIPRRDYLERLDQALRACRCPQPSTARRPAGRRRRRPPSGGRPRPSRSSRRRG